MFGIRLAFCTLGFFFACSSFAQSQAANSEYSGTAAALMAMRAQAKLSYSSKDKRKLVQLAASLDSIGKNKNLDISCRLAATGIAREIEGYIAGLDAADAETRKVAEARVRVAAISVKRDLASCE